jgi:hypothetical protein
VSAPEDLDLYRGAGRTDRAAIARWVVRTIGVLVGLAVALYGVALYALRCFDTCPSDPAVDRIGQALAASLVLLGLVVVTAAASAGTRWSAAGAALVALLGALIALGGIVSLLLVPSIDAPGDHGSSATFGAAALVGGSVIAGTAIALRRRGSPPRAAA